MGRVIHTSSGRHERELILRGIAQTARSFDPQQSETEEGLDMAAFIALGLNKIVESIEKTASPWEKRGYWMKADRFRLDWEWAGHLGAELQLALQSRNWDESGKVIVKTREQLADVHIPQRGRPEAPWRGAWQVWVKRG